jgi:DNA polymerase
MDTTGMHSGRDEVRAALRQQLVADGVMGVRSLPMPRPGERARVGLAEKQQLLKVLDEGQVRGCTKCGLSRTRTRTVFGQGSADARLVFVGEAPGFDEDRTGLAFVGPAGQLLTRMIVAMGLTREEVFICNVLKCRPPENRDPTADEILTCGPYLAEQLSIIRPEVIVALGAPAAKTLLRTAASIGKLRGKFHEYFPSGVEGIGESIPVMPTYHPAYLLRNPEEKGKTWADLQMVMERMGLVRP